MVILANGLGLARIGRNRLHVRYGEAVLAERRLAGVRCRGVPRVSPAIFVSVLCGNSR